MSSLSNPKNLNIPKNYSFIQERARSMPRPLRVAIAGADSENILAGAMAAQEEGFVEPILVFPIARWGRPEDVANAVSVFCSDKMRYTTGSYLDVDGGFHIQRL